MQAVISVPVAGNSTGATKRAARRAGIALPDYVALVKSGQKFCWRCRVFHQRSEFTIDASRADGLNSSCSTSRGNIARSAYQPKGRVSMRGRFFARTRDGDKRQARARVNHHVDVGLLRDPNKIPCSDCKHVWSPEERRHEYDHYLGYSAAHQLSVQAVCTTCHRTREKQRG
jgi:hypothetical protein